MITVTLAYPHVWLRLTQPHYRDPFDMSFAAKHGGRWNPPNSWPTLYLNEDLATVHAQVRHLFVGRGIDPDDLDDNAPIELAAAALPGRQHVADANTTAGVASLKLPATYPLQADGSTVGHEITQPIGVTIRAAGLRGVRCRSATGIGAEVAWFPAPAAVARPLWANALPFVAWRRAATLDDIDASYIGAGTATTQ